MFCKVRYSQACAGLHKGLPLPPLASPWFKQIYLISSHHFDFIFIDVSSILIFFVTKNVFDVG